MAPGVNFDVDILVSCMKCGAERPLPAKNSAERVVENVNDERAIVYADTERACSCGSKRIKIEAKFDGGSNEAEAG